MVGGGSGWRWRWLEVAVVGGGGGWRWRWLEVAVMAEPVRKCLIENNLNMETSCLFGIICFQKLVWYVV